MVFFFLSVQALAAQPIHPIHFKVLRNKVRVNGNSDVDDEVIDIDHYFFAPALASASAASLPGTPLCPGT